MADPVPPVDPGAVRGAAAMLAGPLVFLVHFGLVYGFTALACAFGWTRLPLLGWGVVPAFVGVATVLGVALVLGVAHRVPDRSTEGAAERRHDPGARAEFVSRIGVRVGWLAAAAMVFVAVPVILVRPCG